VTIEEGIMGKLRQSFLITVFGLLLVPVSLLRAADEGLYKGKTLRLLVSFSPGGGFDTYTRAIGRHISKHIAGKPSVIVDNMPGAGGLIHANYMYQQAKPDGLTIGNNIGGLLLQQIMGNKGAQFDGKRFEFIGAPAIDTPVCALTKASGVTSLETWFAAKEPVKLGVEPYKGTSEIKLAAESGELAGGCWAWESVKATWSKALQSGDANVVVTVMPKRHPELPNVPTALEFAKTDDARRVLKYAVHDIAVISRLYFLPPGTPKDRVQMLRKAFADTLRDPEFLADAKRTKLDIDAVSGEEVEQVVQDLYKIEAPMLARLKEVLLPK
jgi:tripartite-type tricarboxylate transporter receptor subunit TctC